MEATNGFRRDLMEETFQPKGWPISVTVRELSITQVLEITDTLAGEDAARSGFVMVAAAATGPDGKRFTVEELETLPGRYSRGFFEIARAANRLNGWAATPDAAPASPT